MKITVYKPDECSSDDSEDDCEFDMLSPLEDKYND